jgi:peroxiredoxin Q/BCP
MVPAVGAKAPAFTLPRDGGGTLALADFKGRKLVLYFYPKADTPGCTRESIAFSSLKRAFAKADTDVVGVSADPVKAQDKFRDKHKLQIPLASDETKKMLTAYGAWGEKSMYGRKFHGGTPHDLPDRRGWAHRAGLGKRQSGWPRRGGARGGASAVGAGRKRASAPSSNQLARDYGFQPVNAACRPPSFSEN